MLTCRLCGKPPSAEDVYNLGSFYLNKLNYKSLLGQPFEICLHLCRNCTLVSLSHDIHASKYYDQYLTLSSHKKNPHATYLLSLIDSFVSCGNDSSGCILEVGCNDGSFGTALQSLGKYVGLEPAQDACEVASRAGLTVVNKYLTEEVASQLLLEYKSFKAIVCRHVLEHIEEPTSFIKILSTLADDNTYLFIEVPDFDFQIEYIDYSFWEEHLSYYDIFTLEKLLSEHGFSLLHSQTFWFTGRSLLCVFKKRKMQGGLCLDAASNTSAINDLRKTFLFERNKLFLENLNSNCLLIRSKIQHLSRSSCIVLYGIGCRSMFLSQLLKLKGIIEYAVDDSPSKKGAHVPGLDLQVITLELLPTENIRNYTFILGVNGESESAIIKRLSRLFPHSNTISLLPPSPLGKILS